jgi:cyclic pyranopterin phosphate synthase
MPEADLRLKPETEILSYEEIIKLVESWAKSGITKVRITGGEPLIRKNILHLVNSLARVIGVEDLSLTTNGFLLNNFARDLKKEGLNRINIGLDTLDKKKFKTITGVDGLATVLTGIEKALSAGLNPVKINMVVINGVNDNEVTDFARFAIEKPVNVRFIEYMAIGSTEPLTKTGYVSNEITKRRVSMFQTPNAKGTIDFISPISQPFCQNCNLLRLSSDGKLRSCLDSKDEIDVKPVIRNKHTPDDIQQLLVKTISMKPAGHKFRT